MTYTLEQYLVQLHDGQWFTWADSKNKVYANLELTPEFSNADGMIVNPHTKPTEQECIDGVAAMQAEYDANQYQRDRKYPPIEEQLDMLYWDKVNGTTVWQDKIAAVKAAVPKPI